jgi:hypothetical protein
MVSPIHTCRRKPGLGTSLLSVCHVRLKFCRYTDQSTSGGMYEDVSAVTKVGSSLKSACMCLPVSKLGMEDKSCTLLLHFLDAPPRGLR